MSSPHPEPSWILKDPGSFASIHVKLPPGATVHCESDAVVTFSEGVQVRGVLSGGLLAGLARAFLTQESFFTTVVENTSGTRVADVMMAPCETGGIVLHKLTRMVRRREEQQQHSIVGDRYGDLLVTSGAYIASDSNVKMTTEIQAGIGNSLLSGTGFYLLRASGGGYVACAAYGSIHKYVLAVGETRAVDNGHLVAWSASMNYRVGLAAGGGMTGRRLMNSMTSGEGLMCFFEGPGIVYLQSHKPDRPGAVDRKRAGNQASGPVAMCMVFLFVMVFLSIVLVVVFAVSREAQLFDDFKPRRRQHRNYGGREEF
jgi:uncharacterized protein (TIGR00266 family)